jgi:hypothetical protein
VRVLLFCAKHLLWGTKSHQPIRVWNRPKRHRAHRCAVGAVGSGRRTGIAAFKPMAIEAGQPGPDRPPDSRTASRSCVILPVWAKERVSSRSEANWQARCDRLLRSLTEPAAACASYSRALVEQTYGNAGQPSSRISISLATLSCSGLPRLEGVTIKEQPQPRGAGAVPALEAWCRHAASPPTPSSVLLANRTRGAGGKPGNDPARYRGCAPHRHPNRCLQPANSDNRHLSNLHCFHAGSEPNAKT